MLEVDIQDRIAQIHRDLNLPTPAASRIAELASPGVKLQSADALVRGVRIQADRETILSGTRGQKARFNRPGWLLALVRNQ